ncbi:hypothetical protein J3459_016989 [Metarhizium acridum]|uniref:uncharacterized protein n=1 Tax=Metarhizium acridum TaxID=92637 RepID=UPI001C6BF969|nr:hypothetical protein J3459_016989 [Metarhizium acridum]KAG8411583.1 hypothetical protein J3458_015644 [Metarhizium acridum]
MLEGEYRRRVHVHAEAVPAVAWWQSGMAPSGTLVTCCGETAAIFSQNTGRWGFGTWPPPIVYGRMFKTTRTQKHHEESSLSKTVSPKLPSTTSQTPRHLPPDVPATKLRKRGEHQYQGQSFKV